MKQSKDPFEVALEEQEESPPESPSAPEEIETQKPTVISSRGDDVGTSAHPSIPSTTTGETVPIGTTGLIGKSKKEDEEEEEENMELSLGNSLPVVTLIKWPKCISDIAKMFVGELVETARIVMMERKQRGPIRPCHIREAYGRLKLGGKVSKRSVPRLFR